jgi:DNA-binding HxlR family transcriptional regulator
MVILWAVPYFVAAVAGHALLTRTALPANAVVKFLCVGGPLGLGLALHVLALHGVGLAALATLAVYAFACELYIFLFTLVGSSVSVRLLLALRAGDRSGADIDALYGSAGMVTRRLERLAAVGLLVRDGRAVRVLPRGRRLVRVFAALKHFFRHPEQPAGQVWSKHVPFPGPRFFASASRTPARAAGRPRTVSRRAERNHASLAAAAPR